MSITEEQLAEISWEDLATLTLYPDMAATVVIPAGATPYDLENFLVVIPLPTPWGISHVKRNGEDIPFDCRFAALAFRANISASADNVFEVS